MFPDERTAAEHARNMLDPKIRPFLDEIWALCQRHNLFLARDGEGPYLITELDDGDELAIFGAINTTHEDFAGTWTDLATESDQG